MPSEPGVAETRSELGIMAPNPSWKASDMKYILPTMALSALRVPEAFGFGPSTRDRLPEPFDAVDHVGNTALTFVLMDRVAKGIMGDSLQAMTEGEFKKRRRVLAGTVGALTVLANVFAEKVGYGPSSTPDYLDFVYGLAGGALAYKVRRGNYISPEDVDILRHENEPDDEVVRVVNEVIARRQPIVQETEENTTTESTELTSPTVKNSGITTSRSTRSSKKRKAMQRKSRKLNRKRR